MKIGIKDVLYQIRVFFIGYLILLIACFLLKLLFNRPEIYFAVNSRYSPWADFIAPYITNIGNGITIIVLAALWALLSYRKAFLLISSYAVTSLVAQVLKHVFDAPRPKLYFHNLLGHIHFVNGVDILSIQSFPSGHTVSAFSAAVVITYCIKNKYWAVPLLVTAVLVGYSRMYLSEHFFEDVLAGSIIGVMVTVFWLWWIDGKTFLHSPKWERGALRM
jgi:membrane-associated phospholipid phosphatase